MQRDAAILIDIEEACRCILSFRGDLDREAFLEDKKTQSSVLHQLMVIGEAAKRLSPDLCASATDVPWNDIARMRDKLIHWYEKVDLDEVWTAIDRDVPALLARVMQLRAQA